MNNFITTFWTLHLLYCVYRTHESYNSYMAIINRENESPDEDEKLVNLRLKMRGDYEFITNIVTRNIFSVVLVIAFL